jgi:hypothetical protein
MGMQPYSRRFHAARTIRFLAPDLNPKRIRPASRGKRVWERHANRATRRSSLKTAPPLEVKCPKSAAIGQFF